MIKRFFKLIRKKSDEDCNWIKEKFKSFQENPEFYSWSLPKKNEYVLPCICAGCKIPKGWGEELIIENNEKYCGKLLVFKAGCKFSMHYHMLKDETWYVHSGTFIYRYVDTRNADVTEIKLKIGDIVRQHPGQPHQLIAETDGIIFEVSTHHDDNDSFRVWKGDSQK